MGYSGLKEFIEKLEQKRELVRIKTFVSPELEITEITDRITKSGGPALLFENNGTDFPLLINAFGSDYRMAMALGRDNMEDAGTEIEKIFKKISGSPGTTGSKLSGIPSLIKLSSILPVKSGRKGRCQHTVIKEADLGKLPVLKCWPFDGGRFITLPIVHTFHPETGKTNAGMYRMQLIDKNTTALHWQIHKTGANHYEAWKKKGLIMPVSVALGGDPVYAYAATAPIPENFDEYLLAGFLRGKRVKLVKCLTNDIFIPDDADIVLEGYVDPSEELFLEGPFGDHTGFYSLADWYPKFHVTCITHTKNAVYPATIVGIPPQEDTFLAKATEKIFLTPIRLTLQPEIEDIHMPSPGVAHNLVIVRIKKSYPGQGTKVINSLFGAGQMMFTKYLVVVSGKADIRNYGDLLSAVFMNTDFVKDIIFCRGPMDALDHASDTFALGGKMGIDATVKTIEEGNYLQPPEMRSDMFETALNGMINERLIKAFNIVSDAQNHHLLILSVETSVLKDIVAIISGRFEENNGACSFSLIIIVDYTVDVHDYFLVAWQALGNSDPARDHYYIAGKTLLIDGTIKLFRPKGFARKWPNVVCSDDKTIKNVDEKWPIPELGILIKSPSLKYSLLKRSGRDEITLS